MPIPFRKRSVGISYLLAVFLGLFGVHQFYLGRTRRGLSYLVLWVWLIAFVIGYMTTAPNISYAVGITYPLVMLRALYSILVLLFDFVTIPRQVARVNAQTKPTPKQMQYDKIGKWFIVAEMTLVLIANLFIYIGPSPSTSS
ncbi:MAG: TM2 domain-containing protein [Patescibacteria group bacterium]